LSPYIDVIATHGSVRKAKLVDDTTIAVILEMKIEKEKINSIVGMQFF
jgi:hypothetical protein